MPPFYLVFQYTSNKLYFSNKYDGHNVLYTYLTPSGMKTVHKEEEALIK